MVVGSAGVRGVLADGTFTLIRYAFLYVFWFLYFLAYTRFLYYCANVRKSRVQKYRPTEICPKISKQNQHQPNNELKNLDDSTKRRAVMT